MGALTKQQAISLHLAKWLGKSNAAFDHDMLIPWVYYSDGTRLVMFDPFSDSERGRAQFAECVINSAKIENGGVAFGQVMHTAYIDFQDGFQETKFFEHNDEPQAFVDAALDAIYYAIGGVREWVE